MKIHHDQAETRCPGCGHEINAVTDVGKDPANPPPKPGDLTICVYCTCFMRFDDQLVRHVLTYEEIGDLPAEIRGMMVWARETIKQMHAQGTFTT